MQRRSFFKASGAMAIALISWRQCVLAPAWRQQQKLGEFQFLEQRDVVFLRACIPCLLPFTPWTTESLTSFCTRLDGTASLMENSVRLELRQLFDAFHLAPLKWWFGVNPWPKVSIERMEQILKQLQNSRVVDLRAMALGLSELIHAVYYSDPATYADLDYYPPVELL